MKSTTTGTFILFTCFARVARADNDRAHLWHRRRPAASANAAGRRAGAADRAVAMGWLGVHVRQCQSITCVLLGSEAAIGALPGLGRLILVHGMTLAGELISQASGLRMAEVFDPTLDEKVPLFSRLLFLVAVSMFLCIGGHRLVMAGLLDTFRTIPPGSGQFSRSLADGIMTLVGQSFSLGIRVAAPAVTALLAATLDPGPHQADAAAIEHFEPGLRLNAMLAFAVLASRSARPPGRFKTRSNPRWKQSSMP